MVKTTSVSDMTRTLSLTDPDNGPAMARRWPGDGLAMARRWPGDCPVMWPGDGFFAENQKLWKGYRSHSYCSQKKKRTLGARFWCTAMARRWPAMARRWPGDGFFAKALRHTHSVRAHSPPRRISVCSPTRTFLGTKICPANTSGLSLANPRYTSATSP